MRELIAAAGFYIPLAPPFAQKIFPRNFKISHSNYTRTAGVLPSQALLDCCKFLVFCSL